MWREPPGGVRGCGGIFQQRILGSLTEKQPKLFTFNSDLIFLPRLFAVLT